MTAKLASQISYQRLPSGKWPFVLLSDLMVNLNQGFVGTHVFYDGSKPIGSLVGDLLTIYAGYASDGASPGFVVPGLGLRIGTPSPASAAPGFFTHDFLYQFAELPCAPWTYEQADDALYSLLRSGGFLAPSSYHAAVTVFGGLFRRLGNVSTTVSCKIHPTRP